MSMEINEEAQGREDNESDDTMESLLKDTWMMIDHTTGIDFSNGVEYMGVDEGSVRGWEFFHVLRKKVVALGIGIV